jgi:hypothetical protein
MKFPKFVNKKIVIFVVLFVAFVYFSGMFHYMREGLHYNYSPPAGTLVFKNKKCDNCLLTGAAYSCSNKCKKFVSDNNIDSSKYKGLFINEHTYFEPKKPITLTGNCSGCGKIGGGGNCDAKCNPNITYSDYNCVYNVETNKTTCIPK